MNPTSIGIQVAMAGIGTSLILVKESLKKSDIKLILAILLTWAVAYLSGSSGGADRMGSMFDFLGLTVEQLNNLVIVIRKTIHVSFYGSLAWLFATYLWNDYSNRKILYSYSIAFPLSIALADEYRQSMMPNRQGSYSDVILDMSATFFVLGMLHWNERRLIRSNDKIG